MAFAVTELCKLGNVMTSLLKSAGTWVLTIAALLCGASQAEAGMPTITLTDVAKLRLSSISFFVVVVLLSALGIRSLWNLIRKDFARLPEVSFRGALGGVLLWGLVFVIVLTMISGARELMTPGAWEKNGLTYRLADTREDSDPNLVAAEVTRQLNVRLRRMQQLQELAIALQSFAGENNGRFPTEAEFRMLPRSLRTLHGDFEVDYVYCKTAEHTADDDPVVILEPAVFDDNSQYALHRSGQISLLPFEESSP